MANHRISGDAKEDLRRIYRRGVIEFGDAKADLGVVILHDTDRDELYLTR